MPRIGQSISHIKINVNEHPIDAVTIDGKEMSTFQESGKIVTSIDSNSTDEQIPSAKCLYDMIWGSYTPEYDYSKDYLTFDVITDGTIIWRRSNDNIPQKTISYRINGGDWNTVTSQSNDTNKFNVYTGDKVEFKGTNASYYIQSGYGGDQGNSFRGTARFNVSGNIMSMIGGDNFQNLTTLGDYALTFLFGDSMVVDASKLVLPAMTLGIYCYSALFQGCYELIYPPEEFPAQVLAGYCYNCMFFYCTKLTSSPRFLATTLERYSFRRIFDGCRCLMTPPSLPATTLADSCYYRMFRGCTGLTTTPNLPAMTLAPYCYESMFENCTGLTTTPNLPAMTLAPYCYESMFENCTGLTTTSNLPATTLANGCYQNMFQNCRSLTTTPSLPAMTLADNSYQNMFLNCTSLTVVSSLPATTLAQSCYSGMFSGCTNLKTVPTLPATTLEYCCYSGMFSGCTSLVSAPSLSATTLANYCCAYMFQGCTSLTIPPTLPATNLSIQCYQDMFSGCINLTTAPVLPATTLVSNCYGRMFYNCSNLEYIECYATNPNKNFTQNWVYGVAQQGTFVGDTSVSWRVDTNSIPPGWTTNTIITDYPESNHTLTMYVDDFLKAKPQDLVDDPIGNNCMAYEYTGNTMSYDGDDYYVWKNMGYMSSNSNWEETEKTYILTDTINQNTLYQKSLDYSTSNIFEHPIYAVLDGGENDTEYGELYNIISVSQTTGLEMWIDEEFDYGWEDGGYSDMEEYLDWYLDNIDAAGGKHYYYIDTFEYDGDNCYLWYSYIDRRYLVTDTINVSTLTSYSIESNYSNVNTHPILVRLYNDLTEYDDGSSYSIVKVTSSQPKQMMYAYDVLSCDYSLEDYINDDDPESYGSNYYEYCEPFEYNNETYYIWKLTNIECDDVTYLLTDTIDYQTLQSYSLENNLSNLTTFPIVAYLNYDLQESYNNGRCDNIVKVFEL